MSRPRPPLNEFGASTIAFLSKALDGVSEDIRREVGMLIPAAADSMLSALAARYPYGQHHRDAGVPHMRDNMYIQTLWGNDSLLPRRKVVGPKLAYIWQDGTKARKYLHTGGKAHRWGHITYTHSSGVEHPTGQMPRADKGFFERTAVQARLRLIMQAQAILDRAREIG